MSAEPSAAFIQAELDKWAQVAAWPAFSWINTWIKARIRASPAFPQLLCSIRYTS